MKWWLLRSQELPAWMYEGRPHQDASPALPVAFEGEDGSGGGGGTGDPPGGSGDPPADPPAGESAEQLKARLASANAALRAAKAEAAKAKQLETRLQELEGRDQSDLEKANNKVAALEKQLSDALASSEQTLIRMAVERSARKLGFVDEDAAIKMMDMESVTVENGKVEGVEEALAALLVEKPYLKKAANDGDNGGDSGNTGSGRAPDRTPRRNGDTAPVTNIAEGYLNRAYGSKPRAIGARTNGSV